MKSLTTPALFIFSLFVAQAATAETWTAQTTNVTTNVAAIHFPTPDIGYVAAGQSILKTTNGGSNWSNIYTDWTYLALYFMNKDTGWAVGNGGDVRRTSNGGTVWVNQTNNGGGDYTLIDVKFQTPLVGWAARSGNNGGTGNVIRTTNGGTTWLKDTIGVTTFGVRQIQFVTPAVAYAVGTPGVYKTVDSGTTWTSVIGTIPTFNNLHVLKFLSPDTGYVAGNRGEIFKTTNGGANWTTVLTGNFQAIGDITWTGLDCLNANTCFAAGTGSAYMVGGYVYKTANGGATWEQNLSVTTATFNRILFPNASGGYLTGAAGLVRKSDAVVAISPAAANARDNGLRLAGSAAGWNLGYSVQADQPVTVSVLDLQGRPVWSSTASAKAGANALLIPTSGLSAGVHILEFRSNEGRHALLLPANRLR